MNRRDKFRWALAIIVAAIGSNPLKRETWVQGWRAVYVWINFHYEPKAGSELAEARFKACAECPVYYAPLSTCGSFLHKDLRPLGCKCFLPALTQLEHGHCWIDDHFPDNSYGWATVQAGNPS
jgi:hypothetical protein